MREKNLRSASGRNIVSYLCIFTNTFSTSCLGVGKGYRVFGGRVGHMRNLMRGQGELTPYLSFRNFFRLPQSRRAVLCMNSAMASGLSSSTPVAMR